MSINGVSEFRLANKISIPEDIMSFGVNKGYTLKEIYKYYPDYINWLIETTHICIDINQFESLETPTPFTNNDTLGNVLQNLLNEFKLHTALSNSEIEKRVLDIIDPENLNKSYSVAFALFFTDKHRISLNALPFNFTINAVKKNEEKIKNYIIPNFLEIAYYGNARIKPKAFHIKPNGREMLFIQILRAGFSLSFKEFDMLLSQSAERYYDITLFQLRFYYRAQEILKMR